MRIWQEHLGQIKGSTSYERGMGYRAALHSGLEHVHSPRMGPDPVFRGWGFFSLTSAPFFSTLVPRGPPCWSCPWLFRRARSPGEGFPDRSPRTGTVTAFLFPRRLSRLNRLP